MPNAIDTATLIGGLTTLIVGGVSGAYALWRHSNAEIETRFSQWTNEVRGEFREVKDSIESVQDTVTNVRERLARVEGAVGVAPQRSRPPFRR